MESGCRLQSELGWVFEISILSPGSIPLYPYTYNTPATLRKKLIHLRKLFGYLIRIQAETGVPFPYGNPVELLASGKVKPTPPGVLTPQQVQRLLNHAEGSNALRDRAIMLLMVTTGITLGQTAALNRRDLQADGRLRIINGESARYVYLTAACSAAIHRYLNYQMGLEELRKEPIPLFCSSRPPHDRLTPRLIRQRIINAGTAAGLVSPKVTPQVLRDTAAVMLLHNASASEKAGILAYLGYKSDAAHRFDGLLEASQRASDFMEHTVHNSQLANLGCEEETASD